MRAGGGREGGGGCGVSKGEKTGVRDDERSFRQTPGKTFNDSQSVCLSVCLPVSALPTSGSCSEGGVQTAKQQIRSTSLGCGKKYTLYKYIDTYIQVYYFKYTVYKIFSI